MILAQGVAMTDIPFAPLFTPGEAAIDSYSLKQLTTVGASATLANGSGTASDALTVDDVTLLTVGGYYEIGSAEPVRIDSIIEPSNLAILHEARTWADNAQVKPVTVAAGSVSGLTLNTSTGVLSGTPDTLATTSDLFVRALFADGVTADSTPFEIQVDAPPIPPVFDGPINSEAFTLGELVALDWGQYFTGATTYALTGTLPTGLTFDTGTAEISGTVTEEGSFGPFTVTATNSAGDTDSNAVTLTVSLGADITAQVDGYSIALTPNASGLIRGVAVRRHATAPSAVQIAAGTDGDDNPADGTTSVTGTQGIETNLIFSGLTLPKYDLYLLDAEDNVSAMTNQLKSAPNGRQYTVVA